MEEKFIELIKDVLEIEDREINMNDNFREYEEWSSLAYLSVIAMLDEEYDCQIEEADFRKLQTIGDLYNAVIKIIMAFLQYEGVGITALAAAVPRTVINNYEYTQYFPADQVKEVVDKVGIFERRFADENTCSSDLCYAAAEKLIADNNIDRSEIDLLVFISQTPDYRMPATSVILQDRLHLSNSTIAFDINLGCSAFMYGMSVVYALMQQKGLRKALILDGETRSKVYSPKDRRTAFLFGDGGVAALVERGECFGKSYFSLNSDGSREGLIKVDAGGYRK